MKDRRMGRTVESLCVTAHKGVQRHLSHVPVQPLRRHPGCRQDVLEVSSAAPRLLPWDGVFPLPHRAPAPRDSAAGPSDVLQPPQVNFTPTIPVFLKW